jgi:hypothetical protein
MKNMLKISLRFPLALALVASVLVVAAEAQKGRDARVISAQAGGVNFVEGGAEFRRAGESVWMSLSNRDDLRMGDTVRTGAGSRVELLLNPGSYWRAGAATEFELVDTSADDLRLRLARGSAVVEATGFGDFEVALNVSTPQARVRITRAGVYRLNVLPTGETVLVVEKGRAYVGEGEGLKITGGKVVHIAASGAPVVAKFDKKRRDDLDQWSRERGKELAKANEKLSLRQANAMLASVNFLNYFSAANPGRGFWFWNTATNCYTFLSFYPGWRSPYGFDYASWFYSPFNANCGSCPSARIYQRRPVYAGHNGGAAMPGGGAAAGGNGGGQSGGGVSTPRPEYRPEYRPEPRPMPRFEPGGAAGRMGRERTIEPGHGRDQ